MIWKSDSIEKNFESLEKELEKLKQITVEKFSELEKSTSLKKKKSFKKLNLDGISISVKEPYGYYNKYKELYIKMEEELINNLKTSNPEWFKKLIHKSNWGVLTLTINESNKENLSIVRELLLKIKENDQLSHNYNLIVKKDNIELIESLFSIFDAVGLSTKYYGYKTNRSTKKTELYYNFPSEIKGQISVDYSESKLDKRFEQLWNQAQEFFNNELKKQQEEKRKIEEEEKKKKDLKKQALLLAKYDLSLDSDWDDLLDTILSKNKYLQLAHYLEKNRGDWSDGHSYADYGLRSFNIESDLDHKIYDNITSYMYDNWDCDGRVFRDCEYNYSVLFSIAEESNSDLFKDYLEVKENENDLY